MIFFFIKPVSSYFLSSYSSPFASFMISLLCSSSLLLSLTPSPLMCGSTVSPLFIPSTFFGSVGSFSVQGRKDGRMLLWKHLHVPFFLHWVQWCFYWELPNCGRFDGFSFFIQGGKNSCAAQCRHCGSWLKYWLNTDKKVMQSETTSKWSALLAMLLHHCFQQEAQYFNACDGKSGNPTDWWFPSVSSSLLTHLNLFKQVKLEHITYTGRDKKIHFPHLESFTLALSHLSMSPWSADTRVWNFLDLKQRLYSLS